MKTGRTTFNHNPVYTKSRTPSADRLDLLVGLPLDLASGVAVGFALYFGLLRIPLRHFFTATNWMLVLLAAGLSSTAAGFLIQADWLSVWGNRLWKTS